MWKEVLASRFVHADETPVKIQERKRCRTGYLWGYLGENKDVVFDFTPTRAGAGAKRALADFASGYLHVDAYSGYDAVFKQKPEVVEVGCWAHCRRGYFDAQGNDASRAAAMLALISQ